MQRQWSEHNSAATLDARGYAPNLSEEGAVFQSPAFLFGRHFLF